MLPTSPTSLPDAHQDLRVLGLGERVVQRPLPNVLHQAAHVGLDGHPDEATHEDVHPHHRQQLGAGPPSERGGVAEDQGQDRQPHPQGQERVKDLEHEVDPVLQLAHRPDPEEQPRQAGHPKRLRPGPVHQPPTAV